MLQLYAQMPADSIELVVHKGRPSAACTLDRTSKSRERIVNLVVFEAVPENAAVEATVVGNEKIVADECLHHRPCLGKGGGMCNIPHPYAMNGSKAGDDVHAVRGLDEGVVLVDQYPFANLDQGHGTGACTLVASGLEVYGTEVHCIRHGLILAEDNTICFPPFCTMHKSVCFVHAKMN
jgi:hypothetical protein